jgi:hypothetical protein
MHLSSRGVEAGPEVKRFVFATGCDYNGILFYPTKWQIRGGIDLATHERSFGNWGFYEGLENKVSVGDGW